MVWPNGQGVGRNIIGKLMIQKFGEELCGLSFLNGQKPEDTSFPLSRKMTSVEEDFNNSRRKDPHSVDTCQPLPRNPIIS
jgi:hypothetical protein